MDILFGITFTFIILVFNLITNIIFYSFGIRTILPFTALVMLLFYWIIKNKRWYFLLGLIMAILLIPALLFGGCFVLFSIGSFY